MQLISGGRTDRVCMVPTFSFSFSVTIAMAIVLVRRLFFPFLSLTLADRRCCLLVFSLTAMCRPNLSPVDNRNTFFTSFLIQGNRKLYEMLYVYALELERLGCFMNLTDFSKNVQLTVSSSILYRGRFPVSSFFSPPTPFSSSSGYIFSTLSA